MTRTLDRQQSDWLAIAEGLKGRIEYISDQIEQDTRLIANTKSHTRRKHYAKKRGEFEALLEDIRDWHADALIVYESFGEES